MKCAKCGKELDDGAVFCDSCGKLAISRDYTEISAGTDTHKVKKPKRIWIIITAAVIAAAIGVLAGYSVIQSDRRKREGLGRISSQRSSFTIYITPHTSAAAPHETQTINRMI